MNEVEFFESQEDTEAGATMMEALLKYFGEDAPEPREGETYEQAVERVCDRRLYKDTTYGAWLKIRPYGLAIGSIVEGSDAEFDYTLYLDEYAGMTDVEFYLWMDETINALESDVEAAYAERDNNWPEDEDDNQ